MSGAKAVSGPDHPLLGEWRRVWEHVIGVRKIEDTAPDKLVLNEKILNSPGGPPVFAAIDSSFDGVRASYVALVITYGEMPRVMHKTGSGGINAGEKVIRGGATLNRIERWGVNNIIRKIRRRYPASPPIVIVADNLDIVQKPRKKLSRAGPIEFIWMSRNTRLMSALDDAAKTLRRSQPVDPAAAPRISAFINQRRLERACKKSI